jgi:MFS family permease
MVVLDVAIVNVALPSIQTDLGFAPEDLQWVVSGYALTFGGFLLLGGRAGDLLGRRMVFMIGLAAFAAFSLLAGLSTSPGMLIGARLLQGAAGAILSPSVFSITSVLFKEGAERNKALGILGAIAGSGAAIGVLAGGVLTQYLGWEWIFFVNVPIGIAALAFVPRYVTESRADGLTRHFDTAGAVTVTGSLMALVYGLTQSTNNGWTSIQTIGSLAGSAVLMAAFLWIENRSRSPLVSLGFFRRRTPTAANVIGLGLGTMTFGMFFLLSLYMQQVLGDQDRCCLPGRCVDRGRVLGCLPGARDAGGREADPRRRDGPPRRWPRLLHASLAARLLRRRPPARLPADRHRARVRVRAGLDRRARGDRRS